MIYQSLSIENIIRGTSTLIVVIISIIIGLTILRKYFDFGEKTFLTVGLTWIFLSSAWWPGAFSFLTFVLTGTEWSPELFYLIGNIFLPIALISWIYSFSSLLYPQKKKFIILIYMVISVAYAIVFLFLLFTGSTELIGEYHTIFEVEYKGITLLFALFAILSFFITGILFARNSFKSKDPKIKWKGRFLLLAFVLFTGATILDAAIALNAIGVLIIRLLIVLSSIGYYLGFLLPNKIAKSLIKNQ
jgi:hypothetical protein